MGDRKTPEKDTAADAEYVRKIALSAPVPTGQKGAELRRLFVPVGGAAE
ncbi:hypothetical protein [Streptomyces umbrinus]